MISTIIRIDAAEADFNSIEINRKTNLTIILNLMVVLNLTKPRNIGHRTIVIPHCTKMGTSQNRSVTSSLLPTPENTIGSSALCNPLTKRDSSLNTLIVAWLSKRIGCYRITKFPIITATVTKILPGPPGGGWPPKGVELAIGSDFWSNSRSAGTFC
jgi:hypothetical protein